MEVTDRGYRFFTLHDEHGAVARVRGHFERTQKDAPIAPNQRFVLDFYGLGGSIELEIATPPVRETPQQRAALQRQRIEASVPLVSLSPQDSVSSPAVTLSVERQREGRPSVTSIRSAALARMRTDASAATLADTVAVTALSVGGSATPPAAPGPVALQVGPVFNSPFDIDHLDGWGLEPPPLPPPLPPGGGGGGGGGTFHAPVRLELFVFGDDEPLQTWTLLEGVDGNPRRVRFAPPGFPAPDAPTRRTTWFRVVATPIGPDPVHIHLGANTLISEVPIRTTALGVRLTNHLFRVGLEALVPHAQVSGSQLQLSLSKELTDLLGVEQVFETRNLAPATSAGKLRSLNIRSIPGKEMKAAARARYLERIARLPASVLGPALAGRSDDEKLAALFPSQSQRLREVEDDFVCIRIDAAFSKSAVAVWGFDVGQLRGEFGELMFAFDRRLNRLRAFSFVDVDFSTLGAVAKAFVSLIASTDVNAYIEDAVHARQQDMLKYFKAFLSRAVGASNVVYEVAFRGDAWQIRNSADPRIPAPGQTLLPPIVNESVLEADIVDLLALAGTLGEPATRATHARNGVPTLGGLQPGSPAPAPSAGPRVFPPEFRMSPAEQLARLDQHKSIVVVMMENRSYDHLLGDLMHLRPDPQDPYDGAPFGAENAPVHGFPTGVPLVRSRDLRIDTSIPESPAHSHAATQFQIGDGTAAGRGTGDMLGFARDFYRRSDAPQLVMTVYGERELPTYYKLADEFCTCERWFAAHPGPTWPNRFATVMGRIPELENFRLDDARLGYMKDRTVFDALTAAGIEWRLFESDLSLIRMFDRYRLDSTHVVPIDDAAVGFEATLKAGGPLPRVMFVEPNFADIPPLHTADDDHPPADLSNGQRFISRVCDLIWDSGRFGEVLLLITYDEHGGFYDHLPPPGTARGEPRTFTRLHPDGPTHLGVRVPAFVVSPFVGAGGKNRTTFDHTSILKTILVHNRHMLPNEVLTSFGGRVNEMPDLGAALDLPSARPAPQPFIRRRDGTGTRSVNTHAELASLLEATMDAAATRPAASVRSGVTPREVVISERAAPPRHDYEADDFHGALYHLMRPRKL